jgi:hypothetical protein
MNIKPEINVNITITMTEAEAREILVDPRPFQQHLRSAIQRKGGSRPKAGERRGTRKATGLRCEKCGKSYRTKLRLIKHIQEKHPDAGAATD